MHACMHVCIHTGPKSFNNAWNYGVDCRARPTRPGGVHAAAADLLNDNNTDNNNNSNDNTDDR